MSELSRALKELEFDIMTYGNRHPNVAISLGNLGEVYDRLGQYEEAINHHKQAIEINQEFYGEVHSNVARDLNNLGIVYANLGEYQTAINYYEKSLEIVQKLYDYAHQTQSIGLNNLGLMFLHLKEYQKASEYFQQALEIDYALYGDSHPTIATHLNNLAASLSCLGDREQVITYYERALTIDKKFYDDTHPAVKRDLHNLGLAYKKIGENYKPPQYSEQISAIDPDSQTDDHLKPAVHLSSIYDEQTFLEIQERFVQRLYTLTYILQKTSVYSIEVDSMITTIESLLHEIENLNRRYRLLIMHDIPSGESILDYMKSCYEEYSLFESVNINFNTGKVRSKSKKQHPLVNIFSWPLFKDFTTQEEKNIGYEHIGALMINSNFPSKLLDVRYAESINIIPNETFSPSSRIFMTQGISLSSANLILGWVRRLVCPFEIRLRDQLSSAYTYPDNYAISTKQLIQRKESNNSITEEDLSPRKYYTQNWSVGTWKSVRSGEFLNHIISTKFSARGIKTDDYIYIIAFIDNQLYLGGRVYVENLVTPEQIRENPYKFLGWENADHVIVSDFQTMQFDPTRVVPTEIIGKLQFILPTGELISPYDDTKHDNFFTGVKRISQASAKLLDSLLFPQSMGVIKTVRC